MPVSAATYYWDSDADSSNGQTDGGGTIATGTTNFYNGTLNSTEVIPGTAGASGGNTVIFGVAGAAAGSSYSVVNNAAAYSEFNMNLLTFQGGSAYTISGNALSVNSGLKLSSDVTATQTISTSMAFGSAAVFTNSAASSAGVFNLSGSITDNSASGGGLLTLAGTGTGTNVISGRLSQGGYGVMSLVVTGGSWTLSNAANTFVGGVAVSGGTLSIGSDSNLGGQAGTATVTGSSTGGTGLTLSASPTGGPLGVGTVILGTTVAATNASTTSFTLAGNAGQTISSATGVAYATAATLTLNGGTLQATGTFSLSESATVNGTTATANRAIALGASGGTIAVTGANTLTAPGVVSGAGKLTKSGTGTLVLTGLDTYAGGTLVGAGTLSAASLGAGSAEVANAATLTLTSSTALASAAFLTLDGSGSSLVLNFSGIDTIAGLTVNGVAYGAGLYGSGSFGQFSGTGQLEVVPEPQAWTLLLLAGAGLFLAFRRRALGSV